MITFLLQGFYQIEFDTPKTFFWKGYPVEPKTFGETIKKTRMDRGLLIKELAAQLGVNEGSVINWEKRGMIPAKRNRERVMQLLDVYQGE